MILQLLNQIHCTSEIGLCTIKLCIVDIHRPISLYTGTSNNNQSAVMSISYLTVLWVLLHYMVLGS